MHTLHRQTDTQTHTRTHTTIMYIIFTLTSCAYGRPVCDATVKVLDVYNEMICCELLKLIKATIGGVDYKACRLTV